MFSRFLPKPQPSSAIAADRQVYTIPEAARLLGIGTKTAYRACRRNELPHRRIGRRVVIPRVALARWLALQSAE